MTEQVTMEKEKVGDKILKNDIEIRVDEDERWYQSNGDLVSGFINQKSKAGRNANRSLWFEGDVLYSYGRHFPLAVRFGVDFYIVNGDRYSVTTSQHQSTFFTKVETDKRVEIPFSALGSLVEEKKDLGERRLLSNSNLMMKVVDFLNELEIVDHKPEKWIPTGEFNEHGYEIKEHQLAETLFTDEESMYLSAIDDTGQRQGNYFLSELEVEVDKEMTIEEAKESMKPESVKMAEQSDEDVTIKRQGEWYFIECINGMNEEIQEKIDNGEVELVKGERKYLQHEDEENTPRHSVTRLVEIWGKKFVKGTVRHDANEHEMVRLYEEVPAPPMKERNWWEVVEGVERQSWSADGRVD